MVLNHGYTRKNAKLNFASLFSPQKLSPERIYAAYFPRGVYADCVSITKTYGKRIARGFNNLICTGALFIRKEVLNHVQWRHPDNLQLKVTDRPHHQAGVRYAEDYEFCMECAFKLRKSMIISSPLYYYRCW
jgi:hypothetical protein